MANKELTYEEQVQMEFEQTQQEEESSSVVRDLGRVDITRGTHTDGVSDDENVQRINSLINYLDIPLECLPSKGRYYPEGTRISIRSARVGEIREFSTIDEENIKDVTDKLTYIMSQCVKIYYGNTPGHYKDILTADRIVLIFKVRELTFTDANRTIRVPVPSGACKTAGCHPQSTIDFDSTKLEFVEPAPELEKYYDPVHKCYRVMTKHFGEINLYVPSIGVSSAITDWAIEEQQNNHKVDAALAQILQFVIKDWRGLTNKMIFAKISELSGWPTEKFTLVYRLVEKISVGIQFEVTDTCEQCGGEIKVPISFPDGYKSLFVPTVHDFGDELL